jgi:hypothetical protein
MNKERFRALAAAYGGSISHWPGAEQWQARWFAFWRHGSTRGILRDARRLDLFLQESATPGMGAGLQAPLIESARSLGVAGGERRSWVGAMLGAGLAGACAAGIAAGFVIAPLTSTDALTSPMDPAEIAASALGNPTEFGEG